MSPTLLFALALAGCAGSSDKAPTDDTSETGDSGETGDTGDAPPASALADADATFVGAPSSATGSTVAPAGDLDGDGRADILVAAFYGNRACVWTTVPTTGAHTVEEAACLDGEAVYDFAGYAARGTGDLGGEPGVLVSAIGNDEGGIESGKVYLVRGAPAVGGTSLADAPVAWTGEAPGDYAGSAVDAAGDIDGDGEPDILIGASGNDAGGSGGGRVYVLRGPFADGVQPLGDAWASFTGTSTTPAALAHGAATGGDALGDAVAGLGDIDGDGLADMVLGASGADAGGEDSGEVWVVRGPVAAGDHPAADADAELIGPGPASYAGGAVAGPGDLDGDGLADILVAADGWDGGRVYVLLGPVADGVSTLADTLGALGGGDSEDLAGWAVSGAGDTDGDGRREILVGAPGGDGGGGDAGAVYLVHDPAQPGLARLDEVGLRWDGEASGDSAGRAAAGAGDVDGDGLDDLLVGALYNQTGGVFAGKAYLLRGK